MQQLSELGVLIVDCQTTGAAPSHGQVLELGWCIARAAEPDVEQLQAHWVTLPPKHIVPYQVRRLTGFDEADVANALDPRDAWDRLRVTMSFADRIPSAIHFAKFELAFLRDWAERFEPGTPFPLDAVCVHAIACKLYPDLPRRSLRALAGFLGHSVDLARRCTGHVVATAFIWRKLAAELAARGIHTWNDLGDWLEAPAPITASRRKRRYPFPSARYRALPDEPGVYRFVRSNGDILYVGKATSLRRRVAGHFTAGSSTTERALEMLTQVADIRVTPTRTALEAALLEIEEIKALRPPYNLQLVVDDPRTWFCARNFESVDTAPSAAHPLGPLPSTFDVRALSAIAALVSGTGASPLLRARAVGAPDRWPPDESVFATGFARFAERHSLGVPRPNDARLTLWTAARTAIVAAKGAAEVDADIDEGSGDPWSWDPDRVVRHLERNVAHAYQLLQRARWLCLLRESAVVFCEPGGPSRLLLVRGGCLAETRDVAIDECIPPIVDYRPLRDRQLAFDRVEYDRLRTLTTELKRVLRDGGTAAVRVGRGKWLRNDTLNALLFWV